MQTPMMEGGRGMIAPIHQMRAAAMPLGTQQGAPVTYSDAPPRPPAQPPAMMQGVMDKVRGGVGGGSPFDAIRQRFAQIKAQAGQQAPQAQGMTPGGAGQQIPGALQALLNRVRAGGGSAIGA